MPATPAIPVPKHAEEFLEDLAEELQIPESRYASAERSYQSLGDWLQRPESTLRSANPQVYIQGSFRLGTTIRPFTDAEDYDLDLVCELSRAKTAQTQERLKHLLGVELHAYAQAHSMEPPTNGRRCWTQNYADGAQFHMDTLPAISDGARQRLLLEERGLPSEWSTTAIAITDREHPLYRVISEDWPHSNPRGYSNWFRARMASTFTARRAALALNESVNVEKIPEYRVRTPLQNSIQILKRHRDTMFATRADDKPISIVLTTLAAHAYQQENTIAEALYSILANMDRFIEERGQTSWIANPTDGAENFADRWQSHASRKAAFYEWLGQARADFSAAAAATTRSNASTALEARLGKRLVEATNARRVTPRRTATKTLLEGVRSVGRALVNAAHRQLPPWRTNRQGEVRIGSAVFEQRGFRPQEFESDGPSLPKGCSLRFEAETDVARPYQVYWQVVNTGQEAQDARGLRGGFDEVVVSAGKLTKTENTRYLGSHSIECFIVKDGHLAARSGQFIVNIQ